ncbi:MAG: hypothetical protein EXR75_10295 [Myxococcales bacterium]|nr:hypothetical protein [Myxococcales bacterium]
MFAFAFAGVVTTAEAALAKDAVDEARAALASSRYGEAEKLLGEAMKGPARVEAQLLEGRRLLYTGDYSGAATLLGKLRGAESMRRRAVPLLAEALVRSGKRGEALAELEALADDADAHRAHVLHGELLLEGGHRREAEAPLMKVIDAYNADAIKLDDAEGLSFVGRAAYLLRAHRNANEAFNQAERAGGNKRIETLLWRAELFLDKYDPGHAAEVTKMALALAPNEPRALVMMAQVKLEQAMDFGAAEQLIDQALAVDSKLAEAFFVRAGLALRTMDVSAALAAADEGLRADPKQLELLSIKAATKFLAEDQGGFAATEREVLAISPEFARFYVIVGEFAEWEHRYDEIVSLMKKAIVVDPGEAKAHAALGLNLIRGGDDAGGLAALRKAWKLDKFNVRVYNTLNFYEETIQKEYVSVEGARFRVRYHKDEKAVLERYLPRMLEDAYASMVARYRFTPVEPVSIEMYADPQHFSIRTSGLPAIGIQGVCFGKTLAALSPSAGSFNWGMIVWHELAHVFHIQQSQSRVPRWYTEGLAEYETIIARPEWRREEEVSLYWGLADGKIPKVASFNRAFTHVDNSADVVMAYFAASQIAVFAAEQFGFDAYAKLLPGWASGKQTPELVKAALGIDADELDRRYRAWLEPRMARYQKQFMPELAALESVDAARRALASDAKSPKKHVALARALLSEGEDAEAASVLSLALALDANEPNAQFLRARMHLAKDELDPARALLDRLVKGGHDGYAVRMKAADIAEKKEDLEAMRLHLFEATRLDPSQVEPLQALFDLARKRKDSDEQLFALRALSKLDQHDRRVWRRLLHMLVERGQWDEARVVGEGAMFVDVMNPAVHYDYARALARTGRHVSAIFELNSALKARPEPKLTAQIYRTLAAGYAKLGKREWSERATSLALRAEAAITKDEPAGGLQGRESHEHE